MASCEKIGEDEVSGRTLLVLELGGPGDMPGTLALDGRFVCLLAWDAADVSFTEVETVASKLLHDGCAYICCWGSACERVHEAFDEADIARSPEGPYVMSTWHADDPLEEALWFALFNAHPDPVFADSCRFTLAISIGRADWAATMRSAMANPRAFSQRLMES